MKHKTLSIFCLVFLFFLSAGCRATASEVSPTELAVLSTTIISEESIPSETSDIQEVISEIPVREFEVPKAEEILTSNDARALIDEQQDYIRELKDFLANDEVIGLHMDSVIITTIESEIILAESRIDGYTQVFEDRQAAEIAAEEEARWEKRQGEYASATYIWQFFKNHGYSDQAIAGILGNLMAEVGGQTLYIQYWLENSTYFGMCQWNRNYYPGVVGLGLEGQCDFLLATIDSEFDSYGYIVGQTYESFIQLTDETTAALAFAKVYERCGSGSYSIRQSNATAAYNYFVN